MRRLAAVLTLMFNIPRTALVSGWQTAGIILLRPRSVRSGLVRLHYGDLGEGAASLLAAIITLTPGTTVVAIDTQQRMLHLHLLDMEQAQMTLAGIRRDLVRPLVEMAGGRL